MPPNFRRFLPLILIAVFVLVLLPTLLKKKTASGPSQSVRATRTIAAMNLIDKTEQAYRTQHGGYTSHLADLIATSPGLSKDLVIGLAVQLDSGSGGQSYYAQVESDVLSLVRARAGKKLIVNSCLIERSGSGVTCPSAAA